jgi:hypothetical protein
MRWEDRTCATLVRGAEVRRGDGKSEVAQLPLASLPETRKNPHMRAEAIQWEQPSGHAGRLEAFEIDV